MPKPHGCSWKRYPPEDRTPQFYIVLFILCLFVMIFGFICVNTKDESPKKPSETDIELPRQ